MRKAKFPHGHLSSSAQHTKGYINVLVLSELRTKEGHKHCMIKKNPNPQLGLKNYSIFHVFYLPATYKNCPILHRFQSPGQLMGITPCLRNPFREQKVQGPSALPGGMSRFLCPRLHGDNHSSRTQSQVFW